MEKPGSHQSNQKRNLNNIGRYFVLAIFSALALEAIINYGNVVVLLVYFGVMSISAVIGRWYNLARDRGLFIRLAGDLGIISGLGLLLWGAYHYLMG